MKVVAIISQHQDLMDLVEENDKSFAELNDQVKILEKIAIENKAAFFHRFEQKLIELNLVPADTDFPAKQVKISLETNAILMGDKEEDDSGLPEFIKQLLARKRKNSKGENDVD